MQQASFIRRRMITARAIIILIGTCTILTFIGTVLTTAASVDHVMYPRWVTVSLDTMNILLSPVAGMNFLFLFLSGKKHSLLADLFLIAFYSGMISLSLYFAQRDHFLTTDLFIMFAFSFLIDWIRFFPSLESPVGGKSTRIDGSEVVLPPAMGAHATTPCVICKALNPYDICMDCEIKHKSEIHKVRSHNMRAKKLSEPATLSIAQWLNTLAEHNYRCAYCPTGTYEVLEHYIPLGSGDRQGGTTALNCMPSCKKCNLEKSNKHPEWKK